MNNKTGFSFLFLAFLLTACGGGDSDSTPPERSTGTISGIVFDAPVSGSIVTVWEYKDGKLGRQLGQTTSDQNGNYSISVKSLSMPVYVLAEGGAYRDPVTEEVISISNDKHIEMTSVINYSEGSNQSVMVTPISHMVTGLAEYNIEKGQTASSAVSSAIAIINSMYGFNVNETKPIDITQGGQSSSVTNGHKYGALLTAYSSYSKDLIDLYPIEESYALYTSMHLSDIQYRDIRADGLLNGKESDSNGIQLGLSFGQVTVNSDLYTNILSQHVMIVVNDPVLNLSGTKASEYQSFSQKINSLGIYGDEGVIPGRDLIPIDVTAPTATRIGDVMLAGKDTLNIKVTDDIGVNNVSAYFQYQIDSSWSELHECGVLSQFCQLVLDNFTVGARESNIQVVVDTNNIDSISLDTDGLTNVMDARIVLFTEDVLGNELVFEQDDGIFIAFSWDNQAPVIDITSASTINNVVANYTLRGTVKEAAEEISSVQVSFNGALAEDVVCTNIIATVGTACEFSKEYETSDFTSTTLFTVIATDSEGNVGEVYHSVSRDDTSPTQTIGYPQNTSFSFIEIDETNNNERSEIQAEFNESSYSANSVDGATRYLKIDYTYASNGIKTTIDDIDFANFNVNLLHENNIPYVKVTITDPSDEYVIGSSAEALKLIVKYYVKATGDTNYSLKNTVSAVASTETITASIPHGSLEVEEDGSVDTVVYYVPLTREILGSTFRSVSEESSQKLVIYTEDESQNASAEQEVYFRSTFDLPSITVVTPFINARAQLEGLGANGAFTSLSSCTTSQKENAYDVATCDLMTDAVNYSVMRVRLLSPTNSTHYYQWQDDANYKTTIDLSSGNLGAYFNLNGSETFYITELSVYQTGFFDYLWNNLSSGDKTDSKAIDVLEQVDSILTGAGSSFFGFDPTITLYATNEMLSSTSKYDLTDITYQHRFLAESMVALSEEAPRYNSVDFATAFYNDFSFDGKANGIGANSAQITLDNVSFSEATYRQEFASAYYLLVTEIYGIESYLAQLYADDISKSYPILDGVNIFDTVGTSIDSSAPQPTIAINSGRTYTVNSKTYVAGSIDAQVTIEDPSGIVGSGAYAPMITPYWYNQSNEESVAGFSITQQSSSNNYKKLYDFTFDSESTDLPGITELALSISAMDNNSISYGFNGEAPYVVSYYVDNDYPIATYTTPLNVDGESISESTYLNTNNIHELTFYLSDKVGDELASRTLTFYQASGETKIYGSQSFLSNSSSTFKVNLCNEDVCSNQEQYIAPGDGEWLVVVGATDNLGNSVSKSTTNAPRFNILIDSEPPVVKGETLETRVGGNSIWTPDIDWGELASGKSVTVKLKRGSGQTTTLSSCDPENETCTTPYIIGEQPDISVQLLADSFDYSATNRFYVTAEDSAYPANVSDVGTFTFFVDNKGPVITLASPWVEDSISGESLVLGKEFIVNFISVVDDSGIQEVSLYQIGNDSPIKTISPMDPSSSFSMSLNELETSAIELEEGITSTTLVVKAKDIYGFESESNDQMVIIDHEGPAISLNGYQASDYYLGNYQFTIAAQDLNSKGALSTEGVQTDSLQYWIYTDTAPLNGVAGTKPNDNQVITLPDLTTGEKTLRVEAIDKRGNTSQQEFSVQINNSVPVINSFTMTYADGTDIGSAITKDDDILISMEVTDRSGIDVIDATYSYADEIGSSFVFTEQSDGTWQARLSSAELKYDGTYALSIKIYNRTLYINTEDRKVTTRSSTVSVQREGVSLSIASPTNFQNYIANDTLSVVFNIDGEVSPKTMECWVREDYSSLDAPEDSSYAYSGQIHVSQPPYGCTVTTDRNMSNNVRLITRVTGTNGKESVDQFNFSMMDIDAPVIDNGQSYNFSGSDIYTNASSQKALSFDIAYSDKLSGVNTDTAPKLIKVNGNVAFDPSYCVTNSLITTCTYNELYSALIDSLSTEQNFRISSLVDNAGNIAEVQDFELIIPTGSLDVQITSPTTGSTISDTENEGLMVRVDFRVHVYDNSRIEDVTVKVGDTSYAQSQNSHMFSTAEICSDDVTYKCFTFTSELSSSLDGSMVRVGVTATGVWGKTATDSVSLLVDNTEPTIGDAVIVSKSTENEGKVRFRFDISDSGSGLQKVAYEVPSPDYSIEKIETGDNSSKYFELDAVALVGLDTLEVTIVAYDEAGLKNKHKVNVDISSPQITLDLDDDVNMINNAVIFADTSQAYFITVKNGATISAESYAITLDSDSMTTVEETGNFNGTSVSGSLTLTTDSQATYRLKITVVDSIGRETSNFDYNSRDYTANGLEAVVDFAAPSIASLSAGQTSAIPESGRYAVTVTAMVSDVNLKSVIPTLTNTDNEDTFSVQSIEGPDSGSGTYIFHYLVSGGNYKVEVNALDAAGQTTSRSTTFKVVESSIPSLTISSNKTSVLKGDETTTLTFMFTEIVENFEMSDIALVASDAGQTGQLSNFSTSDNKTWTVSYQAPNGEAKDVAISVSDGSYESTNKIEGFGASIELSVDGLPPILESAVFSPTHQSVGETVYISLTFSEPVTGVTATLAGDATNPLTSADNIVWTGEAFVSSTSDISKLLTVSNYTDNVGNQGEENNEYHLPITPTLTLALNESVVNQSNASSVLISGVSSHFSGGEIVKISTLDNESLVIGQTLINSGDGSWSTTIDFTSFDDGDVTLLVNGTSNNGIVAETASGILTIDKTSPTVSGIVFSPTYAAEGDEVAVTLTFSEDVKSLNAANLSGSEVQWSTSSTSSVWEGSVTVPSGQSSETFNVPFTIDQYIDSAGNQGVSYTKTEALALTPTIAIESVDWNDDSTMVIVSGSSTRFEAGQVLSIKAVLTQGNGESSATATVKSDGSWSAELSELSSKTWLITVEGENSYDAAALASDTYNL